MKIARYLFAALLAVMLAGTVAQAQVQNGTYGANVGAGNANSRIIINPVSGGITGTTVTGGTVTGPVAGSALANQSTVANFYRSIHTGSTNAVVSNSVVTYWPMDGSGTGDVAATIGDASTIWPVVTVKNLACATYTILGALTAAGGTSYTFAVTQNGTATALTCPETTALTNCADTTHSFTTAALDQLEFQVTPAGSPTALVVKCSVEIDQ